MVRGRNRRNQCQDNSELIKHKQSGSRRGVFFNKLSLGKLWLQACTNSLPELGNSLFRNVHVECDDFCHDQLVGFLTERPSFSQGIKSLYFSVSVDVLQTSSRLEDIENFKNFCQVITKRLTLDKIGVFLYARIDHLDLLHKSDGPFVYLTRLRSLKVSRHFILGAFITQPETSEFIIDWDTERENVMVKMDMIKERIMPDTLRVSEAKTDEESYLRERNHLFSPSEIRGRSLKTQDWSATYYSGR